MNLKQKKKQVVAVALAIVLAAGSGLAAVPAAAPVMQRKPRQAIRIWV